MTDPWPCSLQMTLMCLPKRLETCVPPTSVPIRVLFVSAVVLVYAPLNPMVRFLPNSREKFPLTSSDFAPNIYPEPPLTPWV